MRLLFACILLVVYSFAGCRTAKPTSKEPRSTSEHPSSWISDNLDFAVGQYKHLAQAVGPEGSQFPRSMTDDGRMLFVSESDWTSGFFPGGLWYLYEYSKDQEIKKLAEHFTRILEKQSFTTDHHDVGFMIMNTYGHAYRLTGEETFKKVISQAASSLASRFSPTVGCTRSWDWGSWTYPVIIDNLMNMELLYFSAEKDGRQDLRHIADSHLVATLKNHFRPDGSSFHLVDYDPKTGAVLKRQTVQGYADASAWARGQGWALYGYTMGYRFTHNPAYLDQAKRVASFILNHPNMPKDLIPPWDFDVPLNAKAPRDTSAAAIYASALYELAQYVDQELRQKYIQTGDTILKNLSSPQYRAAMVGDHNGYLLDHGVGWMSGGSDVDHPLIYGDYYYLEALVRRLNLVL